MRAMKTASGLVAVRAGDQAETKEEGAPFPQMVRLGCALSDQGPVLPLPRSLRALLTSSGATNPSAMRNAVRRTIRRVAKDG